MFRTSADEDAPQRTASRKASSWSGGSKPVGSGSATFSTTLAPGSSSQMTFSSSPRPSSSTDDSVRRCCGDSRPVCRRSGGNVLAETSVTIQLRDRTLTIWPCSGCGEVVVMVMHHLPSQVWVQRDWPCRLEEDHAAVAPRPRIAASVHRPEAQHQLPGRKPLLAEFLADAFED